MSVGVSPAPLALLAFSADDIPADLARAAWKAAVAWLTTRATLSPNPRSPDR